jgi:hypothetical protein
MSDPVNRFAGDETRDVGMNGYSASDDDTPDTNRFTRIVTWVPLGPGTDDPSHLNSPEGRLAVAMVRQ